MEQSAFDRRSFLKGIGLFAISGALLPATAQAADLEAQPLEPQLDSAGIVADIDTQAANKKTAIICFSCTGNTWAVAKRIKKATGGTLVRLKPKKPYTSADRDYDDENSRVYREHEDYDNPARSKTRPAIANLAQIKRAVKKANVVYIGYPIWFGEAPHVLFTLVEKLSLKGKKVVPFCTSGGSGLGASAKHLKSRAIVSKKTTWKKGRNFYDTPSQKTVNKWVAKI